MKFSDVCTFGAVLESVSIDLVSFYREGPHIEIGSLCARPLVLLVCGVSEPGPKVIKLFSCSTKLSMKFFLLINVKMPTIVGILTLMSGKNSSLDLSEPIKCRNS